MNKHAYGACVYMRTASTSVRYQVELLISKSRVTPIRAVSLPRLELSAALLLTRLIEKVRPSIDLSETEPFLQIDSTITLQRIFFFRANGQHLQIIASAKYKCPTEVSNWRYVPFSHIIQQTCCVEINLSDLFHSSM